jgi:hypothetical protein
MSRGGAVLGAVALVLPLAISCGSSSSPAAPTLPQGIVLVGSTPGSGGVVTLECPFHLCEDGPLNLSLRVVSSAAVPNATVRSRFLDATGKECAFVFATPRQDVAANQPVTFDSTRALLTFASAGVLACPPPFTTTTIDANLMSAGNTIVLGSSLTVGYSFVLPPG